jgi:hypothetical protein
MASAVARTTCSFRPLQANLFQLFQPMGGVRATPLSRARPAGSKVRIATAAIVQEQSRIFIGAFLSSAVREELYIAGGMGFGGTANAAGRRKTGEGPVLVRELG